MKLPTFHPRRREVPLAQRSGTIRIEGVTKAFRGHQVLRGVDLEVAKGESLVIIGKSGGGKSVLLKLLIGLLQPDSGKIFVDDLELTAMNKRELYEVRKRFGMLFQGAALFDSMTVGENVAIALREHTRKSEKVIQKIVHDTLTNVGLENVENLKPAALSGGMKKRVGLARALAMDPDFMLYDEPTTGLDPLTGDVINDLIVSLREQYDVTSVAVTHDMKSAFKIAHSIAMIHEGRIIFRGSVEEIQETDNDIVRNFVTGGEG
jgi:phospholipid/cholesterol/gamma-HCH transport system ATP-binding protein